MQYPTKRLIIPILVLILVIILSIQQYINLLPADALSAQECEQLEAALYIVPEEMGCFPLDSISTLLPTIGGNWIGGTLTKKVRIDDATDMEGAAYELVLQNPGVKRTFFLAVPASKGNQYHLGGFYKLDFANYCENIYAMLRSTISHDFTPLPRPELVPVKCVD